MSGLIQQMQCSMCKSILCSCVSRERYEALQAENKRLREALKDIYEAIDSCVALTPQKLERARQALQEQDQ